MENQKLKYAIAETLKQVEGIKENYPQSLKGSKFVNGQSVDFDILTSTISDLTSALEGNNRAIEWYMTFSADGVYTRLLQAFNNILRINAVADNLNENVYPYCEIENDDFNSDFMKQISRIGNTDNMSDEDLELLDEIEKYRNIFCI